MKEKDILQLLELKLLVIVDEAYIDFAGRKSIKDLLSAYPNLIVTQTFSKAYGLAGIRLGMCFANEEVIELLKKVKMPYNISVLTQKVALEQLEDQNAYLSQLNEIQTNREELKNELAQCSIVERIYPSDSNFLLVKVDNADKWYQELIQKGFVVRNRSKEPLCENCLRITVGTDLENRELIQTMKNFK